MIENQRFPTPPGSGEVTLGEYASLARGEYEVKRTAAWAILSWGISIFMRNL